MRDSALPRGYALKRGAPRVTRGAHIIRQRYAAIAVDAAPALLILRYDADVLPRDMPAMLRYYACR